MAPKDLTGLIADAQGVYHDLSKGAFDAFSIKFPESRDLSPELFKKPVYEGMKTLAAKFGVNMDKFETLDVTNSQGLASWLASMAGSKLGGVATTAGIVSMGTAGLGKAAAAAGLSVPSGGLFAFGVAVEVALEWAKGAFKSAAEYHEETFLRGDWVVVDDGEKTVARLDKDMTIPEMYPPPPQISELNVFERVEAYHVGFYVSAGKEASSSVVFNLFTGHTVEHLNLKIKKLPLVQRKTWDNDAFASEVRELYFTKHDHVLIESQVSTDPGTEVIYKDENWHIVSCDHDVAMIEAPDGMRKFVALVELRRARQDRANSHAWRYDKGGVPENNGFNTDPGGFGVGDWVWVQRGVDWELAMVHIIVGDNAVVYFTQSGFKDKIPIPEIRVAMRDVTDMYNKINDFVKFKLAAIEGRSDDARRLRLPSKYRPIIREINPVDRQSSEKRQVTKSTFKPPQNSRPVENQDDAEALDTAEEIQNLTGVRNTAKEEWGQEDQACKRRRLGFDDEGDLCRQNRSSAYTGQVPTRTERTVTVKPSNTLILVGAAAVVGWYFFMR